MPDGYVMLETSFRKLPVVTFLVDDEPYASIPTDETGIVTPPADPAKEGWQFAAWHQVVDGEVSETPFNFNTEITGNITLAAAFTKLYTVTVNSGAGGTVTADPASAVAGKAIALDIQPAAGYVRDTLTVTDAGGDPVAVANDAFTMPEGGAMVCATFVSLPFGTPTFTLPAALTAIEESAFEGLTAMTVVDASNCASIGKWAFKDCTGLMQIRLPENCAIHSMAFDGCGTVYVFAPAGGTTQTACAGIANCVFVAEATDRQ